MPILWPGGPMASKLRRLRSSRGGPRESWVGKRLVIIGLESESRRELVGPEAGPVSPAWSADGARLAYAAGSRPDERRIWVVGADGSGRRQLTGDPQFRDEFPRWVGADRLLVVRVRHEAGGRQVGLWLIGLDGREERLVGEVGPLPAEYYGHIALGSDC
jgi:dipeptidyl aminopeptidase/acylaminoacyl peptidase